MDIRQLFGLFLIAAALVLGYLVLTYFKLKHLERMEMIKRGELLYDDKELLGLKYSVLSKAVIFLAFAAGMGIGYAFTVNGQANSPVVVYVISVSGCLGAGLLVYYYFIQKAIK